MITTHFILSAICIGVAGTVIEWFIVGFLFHKYQALTVQTWRAESNKSYLYSTLLSFLFGALFALFYWKIGWHYVIRGNVFSHIKLGLICFVCFNFVSGINSSIYVNYDKRFTAGLLIASCLSCIAAALIAGFFYYK